MPAFIGKLQLCGKARTASDDLRRVAEQLEGV